MKIQQALRTILSAILTGVCLQIIYFLVLLLAFEINARFLIPFFTGAARAIACSITGCLLFLLFGKLIFKITDTLVSISGFIPISNRYFIILFIIIFCLLPFVSASLAAFF